MMCIYCIKNIINNKIYIGSTCDFKRRKKRHLLQLRTNSHHSILLQRAYNKYGEDNFTFEVLEIITDKKELLKKEQEYIDNLKPFAPNGYNVSHLATNCCLYGEENGMYGKHGTNNPNYGRKNSIESNKKISESQKGKIINQETRNKISEKNKGKEAYNKGSHLSDPQKNNLSIKNSKKIIQYNLFGEPLKVWKNALEASQELNIDNTAISNNCLKKTKTNYNSFWRFYSEKYNENCNLFNIEKKLESTIKTKEIYQYDIELILIKIWKSARQIEKELDINRKKITQVCNKNNGKKSPKELINYENFIWVYCPLSFDSL